MPSGLFHSPVDLVLFDRFMIPEGVRPWLTSEARGVLLGLWDRSRALACGCGPDRVLRVELFSSGSSALLVRVSCYEHPLVMASATVELRVMG